MVRPERLRLSQRSQRSAPACPPRSSTRSFQGPVDPLHPQGRRRHPIVAHVGPERPAARSRHRANRLWVSLGRRRRPAAAARQDAARRWRLDARQHRRARDRCRCKLSPNPRGAPMSRPRPRRATPRSSASCVAALSRRQFLGRTAARRRRPRPRQQPARRVQGARKEAGARAVAAAPRPPKSSGSPTGRSTSTTRRCPTSRRPPASRSSTPRTSTTTTSSSPRSTSRSSASQSIDRDIIVLTDWMAGRMITPRLRRPARRQPSSPTRRTWSTT